MEFMQKQFQLSTCSPKCDISGFADHACAFAAISDHDLVNAVRAIMFGLSKAPGKENRLCDI